MPHIPAGVYNDPAYPVAYFGAIDSGLVADAPYNQWSHIIYIPGDTAGYGAQIATPYFGNIGIKVRTATRQEWGPWSDPLATATPPQEYDLPLAAGFTTAPTAKYSKNQEGIVTVNLSLSTTTGKTMSLGDVVATLPSGFRPTAEIHAPWYVNTADGSAYSAKLNVGGDGSIRSWNSPIVGKGIVESAIVISFVAT